MKRNYVKLIGFCLLAALLSIGCRKETLQFNEENTAQSMAEKSNKAQGCRVTTNDIYNGLSDQHQIDHYTYKNGLVDEWKTWYGMDYKLEYDAKGKLNVARGYDGANLVYRIQFIYNNNRVIKEIWYEGNSNVVADDYRYSFDRKGQIIKAESTVLGYYTENVYTADGDLESWKFHDGGMPVVSGHYTYSNHYKSPLRGGTPGVEYNFPYANSTFGQTKWWYSSEKIMLYDEFGTASVYYDFDPVQTLWQTANYGNLEKVNYVDRQTATHFSVSFEYENCRDGGGNNNSNATSPSYKGRNKLNPMTLLQRNPSKSIKRQVKELRQSLRK